jgi:hypothetical protein
MAFAGVEKLVAPVRASVAATGTSAAIKSIFFMFFSPSNDFSAVEGSSQHGGHRFTFC